MDAAARPAEGRGDPMEGGGQAAISAKRNRLDLEFSTGLGCFFKLLQLFRAFRAFSLSGAPVVSGFRRLKG